MEREKPRRRETFTTGSGGGAFRRGSGLGTGPVGSSNGYAGRKGSVGGGLGNGSHARRPMSRAATRGLGIGLPIIVIIVLFMVFSGGLGSLFGGGSSSGSGNSSLGGLSDLFGSSNYSSGGSFSGGSGSGSGSGSSGQTSSGGANSTYGNWTNQSYGSASQTSGSTNTVVSSSARAKYTNILGGGQDTATIMIYLCGTDLESKSSMATSDLMEMVNATISDKINLIVYTGGCRRWNNSVVSSSVNQIYRVKSGGLELLVSDAGTSSMVQPETLTSFINYCTKNYPANRNSLIFWDHGSGSISGYGYDEKNPRAGSMDLAEINSALKNANIKFDFIGFDACLMATAENALMLSQYADYMIASEEVEPGTGWYYTNWLTNYSRNTSLPTVEIGKQIVDDYVAASTRAGQGQQLTLSLTDLAELSATLPSKLTAFSNSISSLISNSQYATVSSARSKTREFAKSNKIDQVDLAHLGLNMNNSEGKALADAVMSAVKYNYAARAMTNSYGLTIYFPYQKATYVDTMCRTYDAIGMDESYSKCIREFAGLQVSGQVSGGGSASSPYGSLLGNTYTGGSGGSTDVISDLLNSFLGGNFSSVSGLDSSNTSFLFGRSMSPEDTTKYLSEHYFDASKLAWQQGSDGTYRIALPDEQWDLVTAVDLNMFYDDGKGYIDLGLDNIYDFDDEGRLMAYMNRNWLAIDGHTVAYYHMYTTDDGDKYSIVGRVPALLNGERVDLILVFDSENPRGYIAGAQTDYSANDVPTVGKTLKQLEPGDTLDFLCDYYTYDGDYSDSYLFGNQMIVGDNITISNESVGNGAVLLTYRFTDLYNQEYWTPSIKN